METEINDAPKGDAPFKKQYSPGEKVKVLFAGEHFEATVVAQNGRHVEVLPTREVLIIKIEIKEVVRKRLFRKKDEVSKTGSKRRLTKLTICEDFVFPI